MAKLDAVYVACDDGYAETKIAVQGGQTYCLPSLVRPGGVLGTMSDDVHSYETEGPNALTTYTATGGFDSEVANTRFDGYPFSPENRVMIHHALRRAGLGGKQVHLATSLPVADYFDGQSPAVAQIERKSTNVMKLTRSASGEPCANIVSSKVYPEGVAAWIDFILDESGNYRYKPKRASAVVDIGGRTTDTVKVLGHMTIQKTNSGTTNMGVLNLYDEMAMVMARHPSMREHFPGLKASQITRQMLMEVISSGHFSFRGILVDLQQEVVATRKSVANQILRDVEARIASGVDLEALIFVGGGAAVFKNEILSIYKMAEFVEGPEFANARGMLKALMFI